MSFRPLPPASYRFVNADGTPAQYEYLFDLDRYVRSLTGGGGSGGDADTLNGQAGSYYLNWGNFTGVPSEFPPSAHTHPQSEITGLVTDLSDLATDIAGKQPVDADLTAIAALATTGLVRRTATDTWSAGGVVATTEGGLPNGGSTGQVLKKNSATDYDTAWGIAATSASAPISLSGAGALSWNGGDLTRANDTNVTLTLGGTPANALANNVSLTLGWSGTLSVARGGTGDSGTAWTTWTPTVSSETGTVTGATISVTAKYKAIGKTVFWKISCTITNVGTGTPGGAVKFTAPPSLTPADTYTSASAYYVNTGALATGFISSDGNAYAYQSNGSTFWTNGRVFTLGGVYEAA